MRVYLAGAESAGRPEILISQKVKFVLLSYYYMRDKGDKGQEILLQYKKAGCITLIDSGAHTFFSELGMGHGVAVEKTTKTQETYDEYFEKYFNWLLARRAEGTVDHFVELDIQEIIGQERVRAWRKRMRDNNLDPIVVLHPKASTNVDKEWDELTSEFSYCGIEGSLPTGRYISWLTVSEKKKVRVHGFAMTKVDEMRRCKFYSVDSTSWISGSRFGGSYFWRGSGNFDNFGPDEKKGRIRYKAILEKAGIDYAKIEADDNTEIDRMNCFAWKQFQDWAVLNCRTAYEKEHEPTEAERLREERLKAGEGNPESIEGTGERQEIPIVGREDLEIGMGVGEGVSASDSPLQDVTGCNKDSSRVEGSVERTFEDTKGKIQDILKNDPAVEQKRKEAQALARRSQVGPANPNWKGGKFASDPVILCKENCPKKDLCHYYRDGAVCYFDLRWRPVMEKVQARNPELLADAMASIVRAQIGRLAKNQAFEDMDGGYADKNVTILADRVVGQIEKLHNLTSPKGPQVIVGDVTIQKVTNVFERLPEAQKAKLAEAIQSIECIDTSKVEREEEAVEESQQPVEEKKAD